MQCNKAVSVNLLMLCCASAKSDFLALICVAHSVNRWKKYFYSYFKQLQKSSQDFPGAAE